MRTIKFRAWDKQINQMVGVEEMYFETKHGDDLIAIKKYTNDNPISVKDIELMQFTGLLDKNGKMIFEGDVVKKENSIRTVISGYEFGICYNQNGTRFTENNTEDIEIIGNIYQNPNLIK